MRFRNPKSSKNGRPKASKRCQKDAQETLGASNVTPTTCAFFKMLTSNFTIHSHLRYTHVEEAHATRVTPTQRHSNNPNLRQTVYTASSVLASPPPHPSIISTPGANASQLTPDSARLAASHYQIHLHFCIIHAKQSTAACVAPTPIA